MRNKSIRYVGKADIRKCYESIDREKLMNFLRQHIKNDALLWLIETLLNTFESGLSIGSYLSQYLCNLYLSELYREIKEHMYRIRKHKRGGAERVNLVMKTLFYMDDILILGTNAKDLHKAMRLIQERAKEMGLKIKESWIVHKYNDKVSAFIDMMGFRIYRDHMTIRRCVFKRIRRAYMRVRRKIKTHRIIPVSLARRCLSYWGTIKNTDSYKVIQKYKVIQIRKICRKVVSYHDKGKILGSAGACLCA